MILNRKKEKKNKKTATVTAYDPLDIKVLLYF